MAARVATYDVLGVKISAVDLAKAEDVVAGMVTHREKGYVCVAPVATVMDCQDDPAYLRIINAADMVTPDGVPIAWLGRRAGHRAVARTYGPDLMERLCDHGRAAGWKHFFYGATPAICDKLEACLKARFPGLNVVGKVSPPYMPKAGRVTPDEAARINAAGADIIWVGLGAPKQDFWCALNRPALEAPVMIGIGAAFDFLSGMKLQAPRWVQCSGMEWLFRLCCEPGRLWRRYLIGNARFIGLLSKEMIRKSV